MADEQVRQPTFLRGENAQQYLERIHGNAVGKPGAPTQTQDLINGILFALQGLRPGGGAMPPGFRPRPNFGSPYRRYTFDDVGRGTNPHIDQYTSQQVVPELNRMPDFPMNTGIQSNINPATGRSEFIDPGATTPPSPDMLSMITRQMARNPGSRQRNWQTDSISGQRVPVDAQPPMRASRLNSAQEEQWFMPLDQLVGTHGNPGGNVLVPANRTPHQAYTAAEIIQSNPELARHLGLLRAIKGND